jgi:hypothetical protein
VSADNRLKWLVIHPTTCTEETFLGHPTKQYLFGTVNKELGSSAVVFHFGFQVHRFDSNCCHAIGFLVEFRNRFRLAIFDISKEFKVLRLTEFNS